MRACNAGRGSGGASAAAAAAATAAAKGSQPGEPSAAATPAAAASAAKPPGAKVGENATASGRVAPRPAAHCARSFRCAGPCVSPAAAATRQAYDTISAYSGSVASTSTAWSYGLLAGPPARRSVGTPLASELPAASVAARAFSRLRAPAGLAPRVAAAAALPKLPAAVAAASAFSAACITAAVARCGWKCHTSDQKGIAADAALRQHHAPTPLRHRRFAQLQRAADGGARLRVRAAQPGGGRAGRGRSQWITDQDEISGGAAQAPRLHRISARRARRARDAGARQRIAQTRLVAARRLRGKRAVAQAKQRSKNVRALHARTAAGQHAHPAQARHGGSSARLLSQRKGAAAAAAAAEDERKSITQRRSRSLGLGGAAPAARDQHHHRNVALRRCSARQAAPLHLRIDDQNCAARRLV
jgi:hypothetical protein